MAQVLRQSTQVIVQIGPFVDVGDGFTPETGVTLSGADEAELLKANTTSTVDISGSTWAGITGCDGWYGLTLSTTDTNTVGTLTVMVNDDSVCLPVFARFQVIEEAAYDAMYAASADPKADINVASIDANAITAAAIATGAIDADAIADGAIDAGAIADGAIDAAAFAAGAINAAAIADGAIDAATFAANAITATVVADGTIDAATFAAGAINATAIANGAIDAATLAADVLTAINAEVVDALATDTYAEPTGVPAATASLASKIGRLHQALRNQVDVTATKKTFYDDAAAALWEKDLSDDGSTYSESEGNAP